jgi:hypothetical protein
MPYSLLAISLVASIGVSAAAKRAGAKLTVGIPTASDFAFECDLVFKPDSGGAAALIAYAQRDAGTRYELRISRHKLTLTLLRGGKATALIEGVKVEPSGTGRMDVSVRREEGRIAIEVRGKPTASVFDDTLASGAVAWGTTSGAVEMRNVSARPLIVPEYTARPDAITAYTSGPALIGATFQAAPVRRLRVTLPAHVSRDSIEITDGGERVTRHQIIDDPLARLAAGRGSMSDLTQELTLEWESPRGSEPQEGRDIGISCLVSGVTWRPTYRLRLLDGDRAEITCDAVIVNSAHDFRDTTVAVVSGPKAGSGGIPALGATGGAGGGLAALLRGAKPDLYHSYAVPGRHSLPKDTTTAIELLRMTVPCTRSYKWDARLSQGVDVVYRVVNDTELPWPQGTVRVYRAGEPIGESDIEWVRVGEDVELQIAGASQIRVERDAEVERDTTGGFKREYHHTDRYEIDSPVAGRLELIAHKPLDAGDETLTLDPTETESDRYRWYIDLTPGKPIVIVHEYNDDSSASLHLPTRP